MNESHSDGGVVKGPLRIWGPPDGSDPPEAYIPLSPNHRDRSERIFRQVNEAAQEATSGLALLRLLGVSEEWIREATTGEVDD